MKKTLLLFIGLVAFDFVAFSQVTLEIKPQEKTTVKARTIQKTSSIMQVAGQEMKMLVQVKGDLTLEVGDKELPAKWENTFEQGIKVLPQEK